MTSAAAAIGSNVLEFYRRLPFNTAASPTAIAAEVKATNTLAQYPPLLRLVTPGRRVLDIGCGAGWLSNTMAYHQKAEVTGIDFNPVAIAFANQTAESLGVPTRFEVVNLFEYAPIQPYDVVVSLGVLHHTGDCIGAVRKAASLVRPRGFLFVGLYHLFGRRPFLAHFADMTMGGASETSMLAEFRRLFGNQLIDDIHAMSWFRDQVLHPHETQHTMSEMLPILAEAGMNFLASSIDDYRRPPDLPGISALEVALEARAKERLAAGQYYPGFFCFLAQRASCP
jgi:SAM-dependent methyltransferase